MEALYGVYLGLLLPLADEHADSFKTQFDALACHSGLLSGVGPLLFLLTVADSHGLPSERVTVTRFLTESGPRIAANLRRQPQMVRTDPRDRIVGRVDWAATTKARGSGDSAGVSRYVCRTNSPDYDKHENQLLIFLLVAIEHAVRRVRKAGLAEVATVSEARDGGTVRDVEDRLRHIRRTLPSGARISLPSQIAPVHLHAASASRLADYSSLPPLYGHYRDLVEKPSPDIWRRALCSFLPLPAAIRRLVPAAALRR